MATMHYVPGVLTSRSVQQNLEFHADPTEKTFKIYAYFYPFSRFSHHQSSLWMAYSINHHKLDSGDRGLGTKLPPYLCTSVTL